jgi:hypothetical protein
MALAACAPRGSTLDRITAPAEGISIMVYAAGPGSAVTGPRRESAFGVIDDRRYVEVTGSSITLDRIDPGAALPSLVIEPIPRAGEPALHVGACVRERIDPGAEALQQLAQARVDRTRKPTPGDDEDSWPVEDPVAPTTPVGVLSPVVRCAVTGRPGRHLVRVLYVSPSISYRAQHEITVAASTTEAQATIATRFALVTPAWGQRAEVALFDGLPGSTEPPREVAHGTVVLDGGTALLSLPPRTVPARLRRVFDGAIREREVAPTDATWGKESQRAVWMWLELDDARLPPGPVRVHVELAGEPARDAIVPVAARERHQTTLRLPLWVDEALQGVRRRWLDRADGASVAERFQLSVSNASDAPREVWIEEHLRPAKHRELVRASPTKPVLAGGVARSKLVVPPRSTEQITYTIKSEL